MARLSSGGGTERYHSKHVFVTNTQHCHTILFHFFRIQEVWDFKKVGRNVLYVQGAALVNNAEVRERTFEELLAEWRDGCGNARSGLGSFEGRLWRGQWEPLKGFKQEYELIKLTFRKTENASVRIVHSVEEGMSRPSTMGKNLLQKSKEEIREGDMRIGGRPQRREHGNIQGRRANRAKR